MISKNKKSINRKVAGVIALSLMIAALVWRSLETRSIEKEDQRFSEQKNIHTNKTIDRSDMNFSQKPIEEIQKKKTIPGSKKTAVVEKSKKADVVEKSETREQEKKKEEVRVLSDKEYSSLSLEKKIVYFLNMHDIDTEGMSSDEKYEEIYDIAMNSTNIQELERLEYLNPGDQRIEANIALNPAATLSILIPILWHAENRLRRSPGDPLGEEILRNMLDNPSTPKDILSKIRNRGEARPSVFPVEE